jgi:hypothetical protein
MTAGQPPIFESAEEMQEVITKYFEGLVYEDCDGIEHYRPALITGLALALGFCTRQSIYDYEKREEYSYTIKRAKMMVEADYERRLDGKACTGSIFALKNMGWKDKQEIENNHSGEVKSTIDPTKLKEAIKTVLDDVDC